MQHGGENNKSRVLDVDKIDESSSRRAEKSDLTTAAEDFRQRVSALMQGVAASFEPLRAVFAEISRNGARARLVEEAGWLPHSTTPFDLIPPEEASPATVSSIVDAYYRENWSVVEARFSSSVEGHKVDEEAQAAFAEALAAHRHGLYRAVCRLLFPEIERVARSLMYDGKLDGIASLPKFYDEVGHKLPAGDVYGFEYGIELFQKLRDHLYRKIGTDEAVLAECAADPVPNRHAVIHGLVKYTAPQNSINTLIMADFMFHLIGVVGVRLAEQEGGDAAR